MLDKVKFQKKKEKINLVKLTVQKLFGDVKQHTTAEIFTKRKKQD